MKAQTTQENLQLYVIISKDRLQFVIKTSTFTKTPHSNAGFVCQIGFLNLFLSHYQIILAQTDCLIIKKSGEIGLNETLATS